MKIWWRVWVPVAAGILWTGSCFAQAVFFPDNGHHYQYIATQITWSEAKIAAESMTFMDQPGHLATVTSEAENEFVLASFASGQPAHFAWIGGYEPLDNGVWLWGAGPEAGLQFSQGSTPTPPFNYAAWGGIEPNDFAPGEDFLAINLGAAFAGVPPGRWIDSPNPNPEDPILGYIVEFETTTSGVDSEARLPVRILLGPGSPNPFRNSSRVEYSHGEAGWATIDVYDAAGRHVSNLRNQFEAAGVYSISWDGTTTSGRVTAPGAYFLLVRVGPHVARQKLQLVH